ncbi:MAG: hypothetical protein AAF639_21580 [Chloroflexota bacterium]
MKLIIIYGSEATGKLTIAKELAQQTGFRLFHNHVSIDVAKVLFDFGDTGFSELVWDTRTLVFEYAAKQDIPGLIFTWAYSHPHFQPYLDRVTDIMNRHDAEIHFVYVTCAIEELQKRVVQADRGEVGKINTVAALERQRQMKNHQVIPDTDSLEIDNTHLSPQAVASKIIEHFGLDV